MAAHRSKTSKASKPNGGGPPALKELASSKATASTSTATTRTKNRDDEHTTVEEQLDRALVAVQANQEQSATIHSAWRSQLKLVSMLVLLVVVSQLHEPASTCLKEIKVWNQKMELNNNNDAVIGFLQALRYSASDSVMEILSMLCGLSLIWLLTLPPADNDFSTLPFRLSCSFIPLIISTYHHNRSLGCLGGLVDPLSPSALGGDSLSSEGADPKRRTFPVILIFHLINALSLWFMQAQRKQLESSIEKIQKLKSDLLESTKKK